MAITVSPATDRPARTDHPRGETRALAKSDTYISALIQRHSEYRSLTDLERRAPGAHGIVGRLRHARIKHGFPKREDVDLLAGLLNPEGRLQLVEALAMDAGMPGFDEEDLTREERLTALFRAIPAEEREALFTLIRASARRRHQLP